MAKQGGTYGNIAEHGKQQQTWWHTMAEHGGNWRKMVEHGGIQQNTTEHSGTWWNTAEHAIAIVMITMLSSLIQLLADPCKVRDCSTNTFVIHYLIYLVIDWSFVKISLRRLHAHNRLCYNFFWDSNLEGHPNCKYRFKNYNDFTEWVDFAYRWSFIGGGSAINGATPSSLREYQRL